MSLSLLLSLMALGSSLVSVILIVRLRTVLSAQANLYLTNPEFSAYMSVQTEKDVSVADRLGLLEKSKADHAAWISQTQNHNLNRQGQILRLHRRGESASEIASALKVGQGEVKLTIKLNELCRHELSGAREK